ncbi:hypothetical protein L916_17155 [Phytophthora nicotianae]|uniref:Uncharacterized protein n=3 Tax=Phytophthora nicotianae TaxID=4792 RepID=W2I8P4_PHYNI|nr:hypothetical protein L916_17155 [Phytophthora nicotianae]
MAGILGKTLLVGDTIGSEIERFESDIVEDLEKCNLADGQVDSDDDVVGF